MEKETLNEFVTRHSLARQMRQYKAEVAWESFSDWLQAKPSNDSWHNSLYEFSNEAPFHYINSQTIEESLSILNIDLQNTLEALKKQGEFVSRAIFTFFRPSTSWQIHDAERISIDTPRGIEDFENIWHPEYIKYCEQTYNHLIRVSLDILGKQAGKDYIALKLPLRAEKLNMLGYTNLTKGYDSVIRNAISHGGIEYGISDIRYIDSKDKKEIYAPDVVHLLDDLFDTCSSIIASLLIFVIENQSAVEKAGIENLPLGIKFLLTNGFASHNGSKVISFIESGQHKKQLNINIKTNSTSRGVHQLEALQAAWAVSYFGGSNFDRILVSVDCGMPIQPLAIINGKVLRDAIENKRAFEEVAPKLFEHSLLWYDTTKLSFALSTLQNSLKTNWKIQKRIFRQEMMKKNNFIPRFHYKVVFTKNTSPRRFRRLEGHIVLNVLEIITETQLLKIIKSAINRLRRRLIKRKDVHGDIGFPGNPFSITLRVYSTDNRLRKLMSYTWQDKELVAIAEYSKNWNISSPVYTKEPNKIHGRIRIKYNGQLIKNEDK
jgi:hypothetical protein